jgi:hypothetical protein
MALAILVPLMLASGCGKSNSEKPAAPPPPAPQAAAPQTTPLPTAAAPAPAEPAAPTAPATPARKSAPAVASSDVTNEAAPTATAATAVAPANVPAAAPPDATAVTVPATNTTSPAATTATNDLVSQVKASVSTTAGDLANQLLSGVGLKSDATLTSVANDLAGKVQTLGTSLASQPALKSQLDGALSALAGGKNVEALDALAKLSQAKLTPEQTQLVSQVKDLTAAYVVQRNFGALDSVRGDVAQVVNGLRKGEVTTVVPAVQNVLDKGKLTDPQKQLLTDVADRYAPGFKKVSDAVSGLKDLKWFGK